MQYHWKSWRNVSMLGAALGVLACSALAQPRKPIIIKPQVGPLVGGAALPQGAVIAQKAAPVNLSVASPEIQVLKRAPIATERFAVLDPQTKAPIAPNTILTLPDGRKFEADKYYAELNDVEKGLNDLGYSLRTMPNDLVLQKSVIDTVKFAQQSKQIKSVGPQLAPAVLEQRFGAKIVAPDGQKMLMAGDLTGANIQAISARTAGKSLDFTNNELKLVPQAQIANREGTVAEREGGVNPNIKATIKVGPRIIGGVGTLLKPPKKFHKEQNWGWGWGNNTFAADISGNLVADGKADQLPAITEAAIAASNSEYSLSASARAGGKVLGKSVTLFDANAKFLAPANASKSLNASSRIQVLGVTVYNLNQNLPSSWEKHDTFSKTLRYGVPFYIPIGPIMVGGEIGVQGDAGLRYNISMNRTGVGGGVGPYINTSVYGEIGLSIGIAGAGVGAQMTLMNAGLDLNAAVRLTWYGSWIFWQNFYIGYDLKMLEGNVYAYVYVYVPRWGIPPWEKKQWNHNFFNWGGFREKGSLVNYYNADSFG